MYSWNASAIVSIPVVCVCTVNGYLQAVEWKKLHILSRHLLCLHTSEMRLCCYTNATGLCAPCLKCNLALRKKSLKGNACSVLGRRQKAVTESDVCTSAVSGIVHLVWVQSLWDVMTDLFQEEFDRCDLPKCCGPHERSELPFVSTVRQRTVCTSHNTGRISIIYILHIACIHMHCSPAACNYSRISDQCYELIHSGRCNDCLTQMVMIFLFSFYVYIT